MMAEAGWNLSAPDLWISPQGERWQLDDTGHIGAFIKRLGASLQDLMWLDTQGAFNGMGTEAGVDDTVTKRLLRRLTTDDPALHGSALVALTGGSWPQARRHAAQLPGVESATCPFCWRGAGTSFHQAWECPILCPPECPAVRDSQHLLPEARLHWRELPVFWLRGLVPKSLTRPPEPAPAAALVASAAFRGGGDFRIGPFQSQEFEWALAPHLPPDADVAFVFTDGSGGSASSDPRLRRCGFGAALIAPCEEFRPVSGLAGCLEGPVQTVPRAELRAIIEVCRRATQIPGGLLVIFTDSELCVLGFRAGPSQGPLSENFDLWEEFWQARSALVGLCQIRWTKGHAAARDIERRRSTAWQAAGNRVADELAGCGAAEAALPAWWHEQVRSVDQTASLVLARLARTTQRAAQLSGPPPRRPPKPAGVRRQTAGRPLLASRRLLRARGHVLRRAPAGYRCCLCQLVFRPGSHHQWDVRTACRRDFGAAVPDDGEAAPLVFGGATVPASHQLGALGGFLWCWRCGAYTSGKPRQLLQECKRRPSSAGKSVLSRLLRGLPPKAGRSFEAAALLPAGLGPGPLFGSRAAQRR